MATNTCKKCGALKVNEALGVFLETGFPSSSCHHQWADPGEEKTCAVVEGAHSTLDGTLSVKFTFHPFGFVFWGGFALGLGVGGIVHMITLLSLK